jgi:uncharacterized membrane protein
MARLFYALLLGVLGAGIVHIVVLFLLPSMTDRDAWSRLSGAGDLYQTVPLDRQRGPGRVLRAKDPLFEAVACRFNLDDGGVHLRAAGHVPFWSMSIYDRSGRNIYSFNDRTAMEGELDVVVVTPLQMVELRKDLPKTLEKSVFVEADIGEGIVVARSFVPDESWRPVIAAYLSGLACATP